MELVRLQPPHIKQELVVVAEATKLVVVAEASNKVAVATNKALEVVSLEEVETLQQHIQQVGVEVLHHFKLEVVEELPLTKVEVVVDHLHTRLEEEVDPHRLAAVVAKVNLVVEGLTPLEE